MGLFEPPLQLTCFVNFNVDDPLVKAHETRALIGRLANVEVVERDKGSHAMMAAFRRPEDGAKLKAWLERMRAA